MSAETLRKAAALMRERAEAATDGTWRVVPVNGDKRADLRTEPELGYDHRGTAVATAADSEFGACPMRDAEHIASWHPAAALAVVPLLLALADRADEIADSIGSERVAASVIAGTLTGYTEAVEFALTYLGED